MAPADAPTAATLSAMVDQVDELVRRVADGATAADRSPTEALAAALYDAERALRSARRALQRAERTYP
ncbi:MAG TPA: hypothetical protein VFU19_10625 [Iamia sp.]|nr:hypothetical protein [Iamia sp.]